MATEVDSKHEQSLLEIARQLRDELEGYIVEYKSDDPQINDGGLYFLAAFLKKFQFGCFEKAVSGLAEQAEQKHEECKRAGIGNFSNWSGVAAWLRATAGEKGKGG